MHYSRSLPCDPALMARFGDLLMYLFRGLLLRLLVTMRLHAVVSHLALMLVMMTVPMRRGLRRCCCRECDRKQDGGENGSHLLPLELA